MQTTERISIHPLDDSDAESPAKSRVLIDKNVCEAVVAGSCFEAAVEGEGFYLLFLTDNNPFEDFLNIHMLDRQGKVIDSCALGAPYSTGSFSLLPVGGAKQGVAFRFIGDTVWHLETFPERRFRLPFVSEPFGVWRPHAFHFHFRLKGQPVPETLNS